MTEKKIPDRPIGYWLKRADEALNKRIEAAQSRNELTRIDWQILYILQEMGSADEEQLAIPMKPFLTTIALRAELSGLVQQGMILSDGATDAHYALTEEGRRIYENALAVQKQIRLRAIEGISESDYATAISVLKKMVDNLE